MRKVLAAVATFLTTLWAMAPVSAGEPRFPASAALHDGRLVHLDEVGRLRVWNLQDGSFDAEMSSRLAGESLVQIVADGKTLWAAGASRLFSVSQSNGSWKKLAEFDSGRERLLALAVVGGSPLLIFPTKVLDPTRKRTFKVATLTGDQPGGRMRINSLRLLASLGTDSMLWMGTGMGEWGGHLVGLDPRTGKWIQYYDALHYVTGITQGQSGELMVSWSMSHFDADTLIRVHGKDGKPVRSFPELRSRYYQLIAYSMHDGMLYGVENKDIVSIENGKPIALAALEGQIFESEPDAIGVAPGVGLLLPVAPEILIIVPKSGLPWQLKGGTLTRLAAPAQVQ
jgi:hypothetical protein